MFSYQKWSNCEGLQNGANNHILSGLATEELSHFEVYSPHISELQTCGKKLWQTQNI